MPNIIQQGTEEGLRLLGQSSQGLDLTAPTPDLPEPEVLPEDRTFLGFSDIKSGERARIKLAREQQNIDKLNSMFGISSKVIGQAQTRKKGEEREKFLNTMLPRVERVYPGISKQIRIFADDSERFQELGRQLKDPKNQAVFKALGASGQHDKAIEFAGKLSLTSKKGKKPTVPQVTSPTKQERNQVSRFIDRSWPEGIPKLDEQEDFIDILGSKAKEVAKKQKINLDDALNQVWPDIYKSTIQEGKETGYFDFELDTASTIKARESVQAIVEEYTQDNPASPTTLEEMKDLPSGSWFINPSTGQPLQKR